MRRRLRVSRTWRTALLVWAVVLACAGGALYRNWAAVSRAARDWQYRTSAAAGPAGLERDLAGGRFPPGSPIADLITAHPPDFLTSNSRYALATYWRGDPLTEEQAQARGRDPDSVRGRVMVLARDGRVIAAIYYRQEAANWEDYVTLCGDLTFADTVACNGSLGVPERRQRGSLALAGFGAAAVFEPWELRGVVYQ